jgi:DNA-binding CsgD family transcriptional regulator
MMQSPGLSATFQSRRKLGRLRVFGLSRANTAGGSFLSMRPTTNGAYPAQPSREPRAVVAVAVRLSPRQRQVLRLLLIGNSEKECARTIGISVNTVHVYVKAIYKQFGACSRGELLSIWLNSHSLPRPNTAGSCSVR